MRWGWVRAVVAVIVALTVWQGGIAAAEVGFGVSQVDLVAATGRRTTIAVELASTPEQLEQGLMYRRHLAPGSGMLFDFGQPRMVAMWMKNTLIPLDMLFLDAAGRIVHIEADAPPGSLQPRGPAQRVLGVLELPAGSAARLGLRLGDRVLHPIFRTEAVNSR